MKAEPDEAVAALLEGLDLDSLLQALTRSRGYEAALRDRPGRRGWSDAMPTSLSFIQLEERVDQLARLLTINKAQPGASVAILAPMGQEALVSTWPACAPASRR